jgi:outer membrane lipoprotein-sorting protein
MKFQINRYLYLVFFIGLLCSGCAALPARQKPLPALKDPSGYFQDIIKKPHALHAVSGYVKLKITANGKTSTSRNVFFVKRPDMLRIETLGFLSRPALFFTADSQSLALYTIENNTFYSGETTVENVQRIIGMRLALREVILSFLGEPPLADCTGKKIACSQDKNQYLFTIACEGAKQLIWIDPAAGTIIGYKLYENACPVYEYAFSNFQNVAGRLFPLKIAIHHYTSTTDITLEFESLSFDPIADERFSLHLPPGAVSLGIEELGMPQ